VCNFQVHELLAQADSLKARNIVVVLVYQSSRENLLGYLSGQVLPFTFVADPDNQLYRSYGIAHGMGKMMKGMFNGAWGKM
jgi:peroxiredoxin